MFGRAFQAQLAYRGSTFLETTIGGNQGFLVSIFDTTSINLSRLQKKNDTKIIIHPKGENVNVFLS